jgi:tetratricopeptide (TPR) repeat protein
MRKGQQEGKTGAKYPQVKMPLDPSSDNPIACRAGLCKHQAPNSEEGHSLTEFPMDDFSHSLKPNRVVAVFPFAVLDQKAPGHQTELCQGFASYLELLLDKLPGVEALQHHLLMSSSSEPDNPNHLIPNQLWTLDQILNLPYPDRESLTHVIQGQIKWTTKEFKATIELIDLRVGESALKKTVSGPPEESFMDFFELLGDLGFNLLGLHAAGRLMARPPSPNINAFRDYLLALAAVHGVAHNTTSPQRAFAYFLRALRVDSQFRMACESFESFVHLCFKKEDNTREAAFRALERLDKVPVDYPVFHALLGLQFMERGKPTQGRQLLEKYIEEEPQGQMASSVMELLARIHHSKHESDESLRLLRRAVKASPENASAWESLGLCYERDSDRTNAEECWRHALQENPDRPVSLYHLGRVYYARRDYRRASGLLTRLHQVRGHEPRTSKLLIDCYIRLNELEDADELATAWVEQEGTSPEPWFQIGLVRRYLGDFDATRYAIDQLDKVAIREEDREKVQLLEFSLEHKRDFQRFWDLREELEIAMLDGMKKVPPRVVTGLERLSISHPKMAVVWRLLLLAYRENNNREKACEAQTQLAAWHPDSPREHQALGRAQLICGRTHDSVTTLQRLCEMSPDIPANHTLLGEAHIHCGHFKNALEAYHAAKKTDPENSSIQERIDELEQIIEKKRTLQVPPVPTGNVPVSLKEPPAPARPAPMGFLQRLRRILGLR